jgi:hypothetical protein
VTDFEFDSLFFHVSNLTFLRLPDVCGLDLRSIKLLMAGLSSISSKCLRLVYKDSKTGQYSVISKFNDHISEKFNFCYDDTNEFYSLQTSCFI